MTSEEQKEYRKEYYKKNKEKLKEYRKQYYQQHKDEQNQKSKERYQNNHEEMLKRHAQYRANSRKKRNDYQKKYYQEHKSERSEYNKGYLENNHDRLVEEKKKWHKYNNDKSRMCANNARQLWTYEEVCQLEKLLKEGKSHTEIALLLGRSVSSISHKVIRIRYNGHNYTESQKDI
jgi:hypothetical protein